MSTSPQTALAADWIVPDWAAPPGVRAACTVRAGGGSRAPWDSLNFGDHVGDRSDDVALNRSRLAAAIGARPVFLEQVHGVDALSIDAGTADGTRADAAFTAERAIACTVMVADCLPVLLCRTDRPLVAAAHAGWRGLAGADGRRGVLEAVYERISPVAQVNRASDAINSVAWLGPCIGPKRFEVGPEVREVFVRADVGAAACFEPSPVAGKWLANLPALARRRLHALGIERVEGNDGSDRWCTVQNPSRFFSYRRDGVCGRFAAAVWLD